MNDSKVIKDDSARSPFAGCFIFIAAMLVMVFLIGFSVLTLFRQFNEIAKFTGEQPVPIEITSLENREAEINALSERVEHFRQQLDGTEETSLALSADDLNLAIAAYEPFKELRGTFRVTSIDDKNINATISFPLNGKPRLTREGESGTITSDSRYLNGTMVAAPHLLKREIVLSLDRIEVPGKKVAPEFTNQMSPYRITERYLKDPLIGPAMAKLTRVELSGGRVMLIRKPGENPVDLITNDQVDSASGRLFKTLGIAAACFLAFAGIIVLIGVRAKARKARNP
ncbi:hypothetical protein JIN84_14815 [Luteolibacter yonseiensis]|uniref:Uncharacterized protein n=1 Tax=Luteolibacter yonseiensis TaxID=1144680 RepID=A0A934R7Z3_9BACT|nr:hypothetical protein [Luteolibacter yonseiensis]MBK1816895.1 hypothetical protein [Luteolibacter yonseiensis]